MAKASKLLGIENTIGEEPAITIQHSGYLYMKENEKKAMNSWKKRFCVVKDGFLLWYITNTHQGFDRKPKGILPLNGAWINHLEDTDDARIIEIIHPDIARANFLLRSENKVIAKDWFFCFDNSKKATWENAQLGYAMLEKMRAQGTKIEAQKTDAVKELEEKVARLNKENQDKLRILQREQKQEENFKKKLEEEIGKMKEREENIENIEKLIEESEKIHKQAAEKRKSMEMKLSLANMALRRLETSFEEEFNKPNQNAPSNLGVDVKKSVAALRGFFEKTFESHKQKQKLYVGKKLQVIQETLKRKPGLRKE